MRKQRFFREARGRWGLSALICAALVAHGPVLEANGPNYTAVAIGTPDATSRGYDINDLGHIVGQMNGLAFLYSDGVVTSLGALGTGNTSVAYGINNVGQIVGQSTTVAKNGPTAFLYANGEMISLGMPAPSGGSSSVRASAAVGINDSGQVALWTQHTDGRHSSYIFDSTGGEVEPEMIPFQGRDNVKVAAINRHGVVTGLATKADDPASMAFRYHTATGGEIEDLGRLHGMSGGVMKEGYGSMGVGINDRDVVVGESLLPSSTLRGFIHEPGVHGVREISPWQADSYWYLTSYAQDINNAGQIVGSSELWLEGSSERLNHAFLKVEGFMWDLNALVVNDLAGVVLETASAINEWGQIVAEGVNGDLRQIYLLNPHSFVTLQLTEGSETTLNIKAIAGMEYSAYETPEASGGTFAALIGGVAGAQRDVFLTHTGATDAAVLGDIIRLTGTEDDLFVLQLSYNPALADSLDPELLALGWFDPEDNTWKNAVEGNTGSEVPEFVLGAYDPGLHTLGYYGVDIENHHVWAVLNHNSDFAVIPEPSTWACLLLGGAGLLFWSRRRLRLPTS